ncbi:MAG TPA: GNVR domain-containing protein [Candidatus Krumholzibacteria bacterium]|nr:GNVR domain-containing protein [Candidatus Krumholzibacteria bacterium]
MRKITPQDQEPGFRLNLGEYARVLWRKRYFLLVPLIISVIVSNIGVRFLVPEYESSSVIRLGSTTSVDTEVDRFFQSDVRRRSRDAEVGLQLEADILGSAFLDELIRRLRMDQDPHLIAMAEHQRATQHPGVTVDELVMRRLRAFLKKRISIDREGPSMFRVAYADANPEACYIVTDAITRLYIELQRRQANQALQDVSEFSEEQLAVYKERLDRSERELARFQEQLAQRSTSSNPVNQGNVTLADRLRNDLDLGIRSAESTLDRIRGPMAAQLKGVPNRDRVLSDPELRKLVSDLTTRRESELLGELTSGTGSGTTPGGESAIANTQQAIQRRLSAVVSARFPDLAPDYRPIVVEYFYQQAEIDALVQKRSRLDGYIRAFRSQVQTAPQMDTELARLRQEVERNRTLYDTFANAARTTQISREAQNTELGATVFLVEAASKPLAPVRPDRVKIMVLAFVLGITVGSAGLLLTEFTDSSFRSVEDVERTLGLKVLGTVPRFEKSRWRHDAARKRVVVWGVTVAVLLGVALSAFYFYGKSTREQLIDLDLSNTPATSTQGQ